MILSEKTNDLFNTQIKDWDLARINYGLLVNIKTRTLNLGGFDIRIQFNPERMRSSAAKVDTKSIEARPCFLCSSNRPSQQQGIVFDDDMTILVNPFPIFPKHLTIPSQSHLDQRILPNFRKMLNLASSLPDYIVFYNGPRCGASAPDHLHFQAGDRGFLPIESDFEGGAFTRLIAFNHGVEVLHWTGYCRGIITLRGEDINWLVNVFNGLYEKISGLQTEMPEPMLNILAYLDRNKFIVHILPRILHRPSQFYETGSRQILLSPASVDLGGVIITPREEDFNKLNESDIKDSFRQVCLSESEIVKFF